MEDIKKSTYNYLDKYLIEVRAQGRYAFTAEELKSQFNLSFNALNQLLYRLKCFSLFLFQPPAAK